MLRSMTGHGEARADGPGFEIHVDVRSVNNRYLRIVTKLPEEIVHLQAELEEVVRVQINRGTVFVSVRFRPTRRSDFYSLDEEILKSYYTRLNVLASELQSRETITLKDLLLVPGVIQTDEGATPEQEETVVALAKRALATALESVNAMRAREGGNLEKEFRERWRVLGLCLDRIGELAPEAMVEYRKRLEERIAQLLSGHDITLDSDDLVKEVAIMAERSDISEEIARMRSHLDQFQEALDSEGAVGRKLEFIVQEMFREANTMGSKSIHPALNRMLVDFKTDLDRLKEQAQNIE